MCIAGLSGQSRGSPDQVMERDGEDGADHASDSHASEIQELREKLQMAQEEMELVRADLDKRLGQVQQAAADERADLTEQLRKAQLMAETAKEEGEEQRCKTQEAERQLDAQARENEDLQRQLEETEQRAKTEVDAIRLKIELEGLRQLEEVRRQFDRERDWGSSGKNDTPVFSPRMTWAWRVGQRTPPTVCCWTSPSPSRGYSLVNDPSGLRAF